MKAIWNGVVLAESDETVVIEGNHYFPKDSINKQFFQESDRHTVCSWKGTASYYSIVVDGKENINAAWFYPKPSAASNEIKGRIAFWHGVEIQY